MLTTVRRFRWAACQLDALAQCVTRGKVRRALQDLPKTLDETYARILHAIEEGQNAEEALKILTWLSYAERPLTTAEVSQVTGIVIGEECRFDEDEVLEDSNDILRICSSLVSIATAGTGNNKSDDDDDDSTYDQIFDGEQGPDAGVIYVRLAHFSVKEYLISTRPSIERYRLSGQESHDTLATCCLVYLLRFKEDEWQNPDCESIFSFARYASRFWTEHARVSGMRSNQQRDLSTKIFTQNSTAFLAWMRFFDIDRSWDRDPDIRRTLHALPKPLYVASHEGLAQAVSAVLAAGAEVNAQGGEYGNALQVASLRGHEEVVQTLLAAGAEVNAQGGEYGNALQAASREGDKKVVQMLLAAGAEVNAQGGEYGNALQAASIGGQEKVVQTLLAAGAEVNAQGGEYGNALQAASRGGDKKVVQMLLAAGAEVNAQGGQFGNALQAASREGDEKVVQMLLAAGAEVNAQGGQFGNALQAASLQGHEEVVQTLLAAGAEVNA
jgi:ankyrin repeat protein